jgi:RNA polymerase sigma factor (sigma-70 family)
VGGQGNEGVTAGILQNPGGVGYVNQSYALENDLPQAAVVNADGNEVYPTLEATTDAILVVDDSGRVTQFNANFIRMWGVPPELMEAREYDRLVLFMCSQANHPELCRAKSDEIRASSSPESIDVLELADGRTFERFSRTQVMAGSSVGRVWIFRDIKERNARYDQQEILDLIESGGAMPSEPMEQRELQDAVRKTVMNMPEHLREILLLSYFHQFPYKQISDILSIPLGTVKSRLHAAVAHFAERWKSMNQHRAMS